MSKKTRVNLDVHNFFILFNYHLNDKDEDVVMSENDKKLLEEFITIVRRKVKSNTKMIIINDLEKYEDFDDTDVIDIKLHSYKKYVEQNEICIKKDKKTGVDEEYTKNSIAKSNAIIILQESNDDNSNIIGFATLYFDIDDNSIFVDVFCSSDKYHRGGSEILNKIKELAVIIDSETIKLDSIEDSVDFYKKNDFVFDCDELCKMKYKIKGGKLCSVSCKNKKIGQKNMTKNRTKKSYKNRKSQPKPQTKIQQKPQPK